MWHPMVYANMLAEMMGLHDAVAWFVNTGWTGGAYGTGQRMSLKNTRAIIDAIHSGELDDAQYTKMPVFNLEVPTSVSGVPGHVLQPWNAWSDSNAYNNALRQLAERFQRNMQRYMGSKLVSASLMNEIEAGGPHLLPAKKQEESIPKSSSFPEPQTGVPQPSCALVARLSSFDMDSSNAIV
jgi:phosphoenolpyruvate carboxykinase (ATP)